MLIRSLPPHPGPKKPPKKEQPSEIGAEKTPSQHVGNAAFGVASLLGTVANVKRLARISSATPLAKLVPGINLVAAGIEGVNAAHKYRAGEKVVALTSTGNALGCVSAFLSESSLLALRLQRTGLAAALAAGGGVVGLVAGTIEVNQGRKLKKSTGSSRTLTMGVLDLTSGVTSLAGAAMVNKGLRPQLGMTLLIGSGMIDMAGIGVDYLWPAGKNR